MALRRPRFLAEQLAEFVSTAALEDALNESQDSLALVGARSIAWGAGRLIEAAGYERSRLTTANQGAPLNIGEYDALIGACTIAGATETASALDAYSHRVFYEASA